MKLPSLNQVIKTSTGTLRRFPLVIADAVLGTVFALVLIDYEGPPGPSMLFKVLLASILGIPLLLSVSLIAQKRRWSTPKVIAGQVIALLLLIGYAFTVPADLQGAPAFYVIRLLIFAAVLHCFAAFSPYLGSHDVSAFWQYNKALFLRVFTAALYTCVLWAGLALALAALDHLFGMDVPAKRYGELWIFLIGIFTTWFFLAGVPRDWDALQSSTEYPKGLRIFAQYILFPLVIVYLIILYAYLAKILIDWNWPEGWVGRLVLGFSGTGILSLLLLHPIRESVEHVWVRKMSRWYYVLLLPLTIMLFLALLKRDAQYGMTEGRYVGFVCCLWLAVISVYFIFSKQKNIMFIPASLCVFALSISAGPWGMFSVSEQSQILRLKGLLEKNAILVGGSVQKTKDSVSYEDSKQISSILQYLHEIHGYEGIQPWFSERLKLDSSESGSWYIAPSLVAEKMGVEYLNLWYGGSSGTLNVNAERGMAMEIEGYSRMLGSKRFFAERGRQDFAGRGTDLYADKELDTLTLIVPNSTGGWDSLRIDLMPLARHVFGEYGAGSINNLPPEKLSITASHGALKAKLFLPHLQLKKVGEEVKVMDVEADVLYAIQP